LGCPKVLAEKRTTGRRIEKLDASKDVGLADIGPTDIGPADNGNAQHTVGGEPCLSVHL
jgi:hypothetical protein